MLGYTRTEIEEMLTTLNYSIHHHLHGKFAEEDKATLRKLEDFIEGVLMEGRV